MKGEYERNIYLFPKELAIGRIVRSGFYDFWTDLHIHVEVRNVTPMLRAKGSLPIVPLTQCSRLVGTLCEDTPTFRIAVADDNYALVGLIEDVSMTLDPLQVFGCRAGEAVGILDVSVPHYKMGSVYLERDSAVVPGEHVTLWGIPIGEVVE